MKKKLIKTIAETLLIVLISLMTISLNASNCTSKAGTCKSSTSINHLKY